MLKINRFIAAVILFWGLLFTVNCATYKYSLSDYKTPVSFTNEANSGENTRKFRIEKKLTWILFDLIKLEDVDLKSILQAELPNAKKIYNLRIESEEDVFDSSIRAAATLFRNWVILFKPVVSRRTVVISGDVVE